MFARKYMGIRILEMFENIDRNHDLAIGGYWLIRRVPSRSRGDGLAIYARVGVTVEEWGMQMKSLRI